MSNGSPPRIVSDIKISKEAKCPGDTAIIEATTSPPDAVVSWSIDGNFVPSTVTQDNTLEFEPNGQNVVVEASLDNTLFVTVSEPDVQLQIVVDPDPIVISAEPRVPVITATAVGIGGPLSNLTWNVSVGFVAVDCPDGPPGLASLLDVTPTIAGDQIIIDLDDQVIGGDISISAQANVDGCPLFASAPGGGMIGTNPPIDVLQTALPHNTLGLIACRESGQRQFDAPADGGSARCPFFGCGGRAGIMQIANPTDDEIWNWAANVASGVERFQDIVDQALDYPEKVRSSAGFLDLVDQFNQQRQAQGQNPLNIALPDFTSGNFDDDRQQLELDAIRGYNGWFGTDRFGFELHEFRVAIDNIGGQDTLRVNQTGPTVGEAQWEQVPTAERPTDGECNDPDYVNSVLALQGICGPQGPFPNPCGATLRFLDKSNNTLDPSIQALGVSNHVSNDDLLGPISAGFSETSFDFDAFRLQVTDPTANTPAVKVQLTVVGGRSKTIELKQKSGNTFRGPFLRLVSDSFDQQALPDQNILCKLGDQIRLTYQNSPTCKDTQTISVGRPVGEDNNVQLDHSRHDIRELKVNVVVYSRREKTELDGAVDASQTTIKVAAIEGAAKSGFLKIEDEVIRYAEVDLPSREFRNCTRDSQATTHSDKSPVLYTTNKPAVTPKQVSDDLRTADERLAQSGIRIKRPVTPDFAGTTGVELTRPLIDDFEATDFAKYTAQLIPTPSEAAVIAKKDTDPSSIDVFYIDGPILRRGTSMIISAYARPASFNDMGNKVAQNFIVIGADPKPKSLVLAHEIMHILLDEGHPETDLKIEPPISLFRHESGDKSVGSTKRIGPYHDPASGAIGIVASKETEKMRQNAEGLPQ